MRNKTKSVVYGPAISERAHGFKNVRWVENVSYGLRLVDFADKIIRLSHRGWFTEDDGDNGEVYRGIVYQLPARDGEEQFVYGYADPNNDDCALLSFDIETDKEDAARYADDFAERFAEEARDFSRTWAAGRRYRDLDAEIKEMRKEALDIGQEMRAASKVLGNKPLTICAALRQQILSLYRRIQRARKERAELLNTYGRLDGFTE